MNEADKIRLSKSIVGEQEAEAVRRVIIEDGYLGMGKHVQSFERKIQEYLETKKEVVCVNSGTAAIHLGLAALGLAPDSEVLVQSLTFVATFQAITAAGLKPVACEIVPETCTIDLADAEKRITEKTKVILPVHYASRPGDLDVIYKFAEKHKLRVVEDAAHAFGSIYNNKKIASFGDIICFSFDGIKNITSGEGGAIVTDDGNVLRYIKDARLLGVQKDTEKRYSGQRSWEFDVKNQGFRYHMSNLFAAIGLVQLERLELEFKPKRQVLAKNYFNAFKEIPGVKLFQNDFDAIVPHIFPIRILNSQRDNLRQYLIDCNIECGVHYLPNHLLTYYGAGATKLPATEQIYSELLSIPLHPGISDDQQNYIIEKIKLFFNQN
ncbi:DegT/DnrJ/EryC1/StrS family aminotransferase [Candidatus Falkowbacteria bacterium]|nr:DegT/DnrJ/EryC1/StrS family aminotransferase [Candidatus Falkowbacteria bacterium]